MRAHLLLADSAQAVGGKLYALGLGWTFIGPDVGPTALAILIEVPWHEANREHTVVVELQDADGKSARIGPQAGGMRIEAQVEVGRPPGHPAGAPFVVPLALNLGPMPLTPGSRYVWVMTIDEESNPDWQAGFQVRPRR